MPQSTTNDHGINSKLLKEEPLYPRRLKAVIADKDASIKY
jgi:hypothetical protein